MKDGAETRAARDAVADASVLGVVAFLEDVDPDGDWGVRDGERALRERATDLATQGVLDEIVTAAEVVAMLAVRS